MTFQMPPAFIVTGYLIKTHHIRYARIHEGRLLEGNRITDNLEVDSCRSSTDVINFFYNERMSHDDVSIIIEEIPVAVLLATRNLNVLDHYAEIFQARQRKNFEKRNIQLEKEIAYYEALYPRERQESCVLL
jgi:hypothetical protein